MTHLEILQLAIIGLCAGLIGGMLGIGGSIIMIPAMTEVFGPDQHLYQAAAMIVNFFVAVPAVYQHRRARAIDPATVIRIVPLAVVTVVVGVGVSELPAFKGPGEAYLRGLFGLFLLFAGGWEVYRLLRRGRPGTSSAGAVTAVEGDAAPIGWRRASLVAVPTGLIAGLLGVGGGVLAGPLQRRFLNIPLRMAIANSATVVIATSLIGATAKNYAYLTAHGWTPKPFLLAAVLIPTAIVGSLYGSRLTHRLRLDFVKAAFGLLLIVAAIRLMSGAAASLPRPRTPSQEVAHAAFAPLLRTVGSEPRVPRQPGSTSRKPSTDTDSMNDFVRKLHDERST